jgi:hypothetical protein
MNFYPNGKPIAENKVNKIRRTYLKPQSANRRTSTSKSLNAYKEKFNNAGNSKVSSRNFLKNIGIQLSNPIKSNR